LANHVRQLDNAIGSERNPEIASHGLQGEFQSSSVTGRLGIGALATVTAVSRLHESRKWRFGLCHLVLARREGDASQARSQTLDLFCLKMAAAAPDDGLVITDVAQFCAKYIEPMGQECEHVQVLAWPKP
jgi:hypothetical protein